MGDIYYKISDHDTVRIIDGEQIFSNFYSFQYKRTSNYPFRKASFNNKHLFFRLIPFFVDNINSNEWKINTDLLYSIRKVQCQEAATYQHKLVNMLLRVPWADLKMLNIPVSDNDVFSEYIVVPLSRKIIRFRDLKRLYISKACLDIEHMCYRDVLEHLFNVCYIINISGVSISSQKSIELLYEITKYNNELLENFHKLFSAYHKISYGHSAGFPTIDHLVKNICIQTEEQTRDKLLSLYIEACNKQDATMLSVTMSSNLPAAWQVDLAVKNTILEKINWKQLSEILNFLYPEIEYKRITNNNTYVDKLIGTKFKAATKNVTTKEFIDILNSHFEHYTGKKLTVEALKSEYENKHKREPFSMYFRDKQIKQILDNLV